MTYFKLVEVTEDGVVPCGATYTGGRYFVFHGKLFTRMCTNEYIQTIIHEHAALLDLYHAMLESDIDFEIDHNVSRFLGRCIDLIEFGEK